MYGAFLTDCLCLLTEGADGFVGSKGSTKAGQVQLARLHSAVGYSESEERISSLITMFADKKRFSHAEVVHALTSPFKPKEAKKSGEEKPVPIKLTVESARESMIGCEIVDANGRDRTGKLLGYKIEGTRYGDTSGGLASDGYCRIYYETNHPSTGGKGGYNVSMAGITVTSTKEKDTTKYKTKTNEDGSPCRDFEIGSLVKKAKRDQPTGGDDECNFTHKQSSNLRSHCLSFFSEMG